MEVSSFGFRYFVTFIDGFFRCTWVYLMKDCSELLSTIFVSFVVEIINQFRKVIKILRALHASFALVFLPILWRLLAVNHLQNWALLPCITFCLLLLTLPCFFLFGPRHTHAKELIRDTIEPIYYLYLLKK